MSKLPFLYFFKITWAAFNSLSILLTFLCSTKNALHPPVVFITCSKFAVLSFCKYSHDTLWRCTACVITIKLISVLPFRKRTKPDQLWIFAQSSTPHQFVRSGQILRTYAIPAAQFLFWASPNPHQHPLLPSMKLGTVCNPLYFFPFLYML